MKQGKERENRVVRLEDEGQLTTWQGRKGRERPISSTRSELGKRPGPSEDRSLERTRSTSVYRSVLFQRKVKLVFTPGDHSR